MAGCFVTIGGVSELPVFSFESEAEALEVIRSLGSELRAKRAQVRHILRYMEEAAAKAAHQGTAEGRAVRPQAIIDRTGVARQTVYNWLQ